MQLHDQQILIPGPLSLGDVRVKMIVPPLSALLSNATWKALSDLSPVFGSVLDDDRCQDLVFFFGPGSLREVAAVVEFEPPSVALDL